MDKGPQKIWENIGIFLGYSIAHYADFYNITHVQLFGRVSSGIGGLIIVREARRVLETEFQDIYKNINLDLPDELSRRLGQSIAAASLPDISN